MTPAGPEERGEGLRERVAAAIHAVNGAWSQEGDNDCGHGSEPGQCEEAADAALALAATSAPDTGAEERLRAALDVERLARAMAAETGVAWPASWGDSDFAWVARQVGARYAATAFHEEAGNGG